MKKKPTLFIAHTKERTTHPLVSDQEKYAVRPVLISEPNYTFALNSLELIKESDAIFINQTNELCPMASYILIYSLLLHKNVILCDAPKYAQDVPPLFREVIDKRLNKILICDLTKLDPDDANDFIADSFNTQNYILTKSETTLIRSALRGFLRDLLRRVSPVVPHVFE